MIQRLGVVLLLVCPVLTFAHNDPVPPLENFYTGSKIFTGDSVCYSCHNQGTANQGNVKLTFNGDGSATSYTPGATIPINIVITDTAGGRPRPTWGFELAARFSNGSAAGTLVAVNSNTKVSTLSFPNAGKPVISHNGAVVAAGNSFTFTINWTAPAAGSGNVVFSVAANAANGDGDLTGDRIYTFETTLSPAASSPPPTIGSGGVVNAASFVSAPNNQVAQGQLISIFGSNFTTGGPYGASTVPLPTTLGPTNTSVSACGKAVPLIFVAATQINAQLPVECSVSGTSPLTVTSNGQTSTAEPASLAVASPGIFTVLSSGVGDGAITHVDGSIISQTSPAKPGETVIVYCTGLGAVQSPVATGAAATGADSTTNGVTVQMGSGKVNAPVAYAGLTPGFVGLYQINVVIPAGLTTSGATQVPITVTVSTNLVSRTGVTTWVSP